MEPLQPARRANGEHTRFHTAHMAANLRRIFATLIWIITLVSSSRTRIYPPNEGEWGGNRPTIVGFSAPARWERPLRALRARPRIGKERGEYAWNLNSQKVGFGGNFTVFISPGFSWSCCPQGVQLRMFSLPSAVTQIFCFLDISWWYGHSCAHCRVSFIHKQLNLQTHTFMLFLNAYIRQSINQ